MANQNNGPAEAPPYRHSVVFKTVRGAALSGTRDQPVRHWQAGPARPRELTGAAADQPMRVSGTLLARRSVDLDVQPETHDDASGVYDACRYTEPND